MDHRTRIFTALLLFFTGLGVFWTGAPALSQPVGFFTDVKNLGAGVNSTSQDRGSTISRDGLELYFQSNRLGQFDLYRVSRAHKEDNFGNLEHLAALSSFSFDGNPYLSADGGTLYFASDRNGGQGNFDLWKATRESSAVKFIDPPVPVEGVNTVSGEVSPFLTTDELTIYFSRDDAAGNWDIFKGTRNDTTEAFGEAEKLGPGVNTLSAEVSARLSGDGLMILFHDFLAPRPGSRSGDIWLAARDDTDAAFGAATNVLHGINSTAREAHPNPTPEWPAEGSVMYFSSNRSGGQGGSDLYQATWVSMEDCVIIDGDGLPDCNDDGFEDGCQIDTGFFSDCNENRVPDSCDLAAGFEDLNMNGIPDACGERGLQIPGDSNQDGNFDISDATNLFGFLFTGTPSKLPCGDGTREFPGTFFSSTITGTIAWTSPMVSPC